MLPFYFEFFNHLFSNINHNNKGEYYENKTWVC